MVSTGWDVYPSTKHMCSCWPFCQKRHPHTLHITWNLCPSSVGTLVDVRGRSHSFPLIHHRWVFLAWCWVITRPSSSCGIVILSLPLGVGLSRVRFTHLSHTWQMSTWKGMPASDAMRRRQLQCRMCECPCWSLTSYEGTCVMIWHTTSWGLSCHLSLIFLFPWKVSALIRWDHQASILQHIFSGHSTISLFESGPWPLEEWPSSGLKQWLCIHPHAWGRSFSWGPLHLLKWGSKSWLGALACAQTLSNVDCIPSPWIGWHYRQALFQPDDLASQFFIFSQLPNHLHNSLIRPLYQPIHLGVVGCGLQLLHAKEFTHLTNNAAHEVCTPVTQESGWGPKDWDVTLIQKPGNSLNSLVGGHIHHYMFCEMVLEH